MLAGVLLAVLSTMSIGQNSVVFFSCSSTFGIGVDSVVSLSTSSTLWSGVSRSISVAGTVRYSSALTYVLFSFALLVLTMLTEKFFFITFWT